MRRPLGDGIELDDDRGRIDRVEVHRFLCDESYWAAGRPRETQDRLIEEATRVVGLYDGDRQIGFCRAVSDGVSLAYLADVYVLGAYRRRGLGEAMVREMVEGAPFRPAKWLLHTRDMHRLYAKLGFGEPSYRVMERDSTSQASESG